MQMKRQACDLYVKSLQTCDRQSCGVIRVNEMRMAFHMRDTIHARTLANIYAVLANYKLAIVVT